MPVTCPSCGTCFEPDNGIPYLCPECGTSIVGAYCDATRIGGGAMGDVYRARRPDMGDQVVAVKIPKSHDEQSKRRFDRESAATALLQHESIVRAVDCAQDQGREFLVMEFVDGVLLDQLVQQEHPLPSARVASMLRAIASGLAHAGRRRIVNRDVKPENIIVGAAGEAKLLDYGLALIGSVDGAADRTTNPGARLGTTAFMAPEQAVDPRDITIQADIYALGCTGFFALTGRPPFQGTTAEVLDGHARAPRPSVADWRSDVPDGLAELIGQMMSVLPDDRPTPDQVVERLDEQLRHLAEDEGDEIVDGEVLDETDSLWSRPDDAVDDRFAPPPVSSQASDQEDDVVDGEFYDEPDVARSSVSSSSAFAVPPGMVDEDVAGSRDSDAIETFPADAIRSDASAAARLALEDVVDGVALEETHVWSPAVSTDHEALGDAMRPPQLDAAALDPPDVPDAGPHYSDSTSGTVSSLDDETEIADLPASAVVGFDFDAPPPVSPEPEVGPEPVEPRPRRGRRKTRKWLPILFFSSGAAVTVALSVVLWNVLQPPPPDDQWQVAQDAFRTGRLTESEKAFEVFAERYPDDPRTAELPFFKDMLAAGRDVTSIDGDWDRGLELLEETYLRYRDEEVYEKYRADLFKYFQVLVNRFLERSAKTSDPEQIAKARRAFGHLQTVGLSMPDPWVPPKLAEIEADVDAAQQAVEFATVKSSLIEALAGSSESDEPVDFDERYAQAERIFVDYPELRDDAEVTRALEHLRQSEVNQVSYQPISLTDVENAPEGESPAGTASGAKVIFVVWDVPSHDEPPPVLPDVQLALASGVLYAFDADGRHHWSRRLGVDSHRLPLRISASANSPDVFLAVSTLDNTLAALLATNGKTLWRYRVGTDHSLSAPLTICRWRSAPHEAERVWGLLATTSGDVHVLELVRGQSIGRFQTGVPMTETGGVFDPVSKLAYMPADSKRIFALDPAVIEGGGDEPARSILTTGHASGSLRSQPMVVGPYLLTVETSDLDRTKVRAFRIDPTVGFADAQAPPVKEIELPGWSWFTPPTTPDRMTVVTDGGALGVLGLNLDNAGEALYPLIEDDAGKIPRLKVNAPHRAMAIHSDEHLLWLMAGGRLQHYRLDVLRQQIAPLWPTENRPTSVSGIPLHQAHFDWDRERIFVTTRSLEGDRVEFSAVEAATGEPLWHRQLGIYPNADPIVLKQGGVMLVDRTGRLLMLRAAAQDNSSEVQIYRDETLPPANAEGPLIHLSDERGTDYVARPVRGGRALALRQLGGSPGPWKNVALPEGTLQGRPAIADGHLVAVSSSGALFRIPLTAGQRNRTEPYRWPQAETLTRDDRVALKAIARDRAILLAGDAIFWLQWSDAGVVPVWQADERWFHAPSPLVGNMAQAGERVFVVDQKNTVYRVDSSHPASAAQWRSPQQITDGPFIRHDLMLVVEDGRTLVAFDARNADDAFVPLQRIRLRGRMCGRPVEVRNGLLVTDYSGSLAYISAEAAELRQRFQLSADALPAAAAVPFGQGRVLVPMSDGTLLWQPLNPTSEDAS